MNLLSEMEIDAIGEILNISMGSAATAISTMLDKQVIITTPKVSVTVFDKLDYSSLEPALIVKITYIKGITGSNVMVFRQNDMQLILNQLMGIDEPAKDDFIFDELSMSAASEVMNQMMGASATALSEFLGKTINISTPTAVIMDEDLDLMKLAEYQSNDDIVAVTFDLSIDGVMHSEFISLMSCELAKKIVSQFVKEDNVTPEATQIKEDKHQNEEDQFDRILSNDEIQSLINVKSGEIEEDIQQQPMQTGQPNMQQPMQQAAQQTPYNQTGQANMQQPNPPNPYDNVPYGYGYGYGMYPPFNPYAPYGYPQVPPIPAINKNSNNQDQDNSKSNNLIQPGVNVQNIQFPNFSNNKPVLSEPVSGGNMELIMNVPISVSVEIGKTKRKIKDIMDFTEGTVIELEKQAGAPVDIVVNGQLIARGDVVVIEDNFGVRVTEIMGINNLIANSDPS